MFGGARLRRRERFEALVTELLPSLWRFARRLERNPQRAEDLLQTSVTKALARFHQLEEERAFKSWMFRIVHRTFLHQRNLKEARTPHTSTEGLYDLTARGHSPEQRADASLLGVRLAAAIASLPETQREVLQLVDGEGFTYDEASAVLGIPRGTAASRVARARATLRRQLHDVAAERGMIG